MTQARPSEPAVSQTALKVSDLNAGYGASTILRGINLAVEDGTVAALLGANGAGKTTLLRVAAGLLRPSRGTVELYDRDVTSTTAHARARDGVCLIPEGRGIFPNLTVRENLRMFSPAETDGADPEDIAGTIFPALSQRMKQVAGTMSGGQQQMLALCRAWLAKPRIVLLDEVSMGLAPKVVDEIFEALQKLVARGTALLIVEQYVSRALAIADVVHLLDRGQIASTGPASDYNESVLTSGYLGSVQVRD